MYATMYTCRNSFFDITTYVLYTTKTASLGNSISLEQSQFYWEHKLLPVHLTWLLLVYGKILFLSRRCVQNIILYYIFEFFAKCLIFVDKW